MKKTIFIVLLFYCSTITFSQTTEKIYQPSKNPELIDEFLSIVSPVLKGEEISNITNNISPEAYIIINNKYESIFEILSNPIKKSSLTEGKDIKYEFLRLIIQDDNKSAYMVLETRQNNSSNWHTILFRMADNNSWQVMSWHKS
ncbi:MAG: hypothetical protein RDU14_08295 [Melioribacteraceae bacterium]|nr:hypothetical protein [Melioribacteraceae bacterium]